MGFLTCGWVSDLRVSRLLNVRLGGLLRDLNRQPRPTGKGWSFIDLPTGKPLILFLRKSGSLRDSHLPRQKQIDCCKTTQLIYFINNPTRARISPGFCAAYPPCKLNIFSALGNCAILHNCIVQDCKVGAFVLCH